MSESFVNSITTVILAIVGVAVLAVLVSKNADTSNVVTSGGNALSGFLKTALSPIAGNGFGAGFNV